MRRLVLPLLLLLAVACTSTSNLKPAEPITTASTDDFEVRVLRTLFTDEFRSDGTSDARVILAVTNKTSEPYVVERVFVQGTGGRYYVPLRSYKAERTLEPGATATFNFKVAAVAPAKFTRDSITWQTTIEAQSFDSVMREERFSARVRPVTLNARHTFASSVRSTGFQWNYNGSTNSLDDYPPISLWNPADYYGLPRP